jgi:hypothetical protein
MASHRDRQADQRAAERDAAGIRTNVPMGSAEIERAMRSVIRAALLEDRPIELTDFHKALVPAEEVRPRFKRLLQSVQNELAAERGAA